MALQLLFLSVRTWQKESPCVYRLGKWDQRTCRDSKLSALVGCSQSSKVTRPVLQPSICPQVSVVSSEELQTLDCNAGKLKNPTENSENAAIESCSCSLFQCRLLYIDKTCQVGVYGKYILQKATGQFSPPKKNIFYVKKYA